jgi:hypothetical protein
MRLSAGLIDELPVVEETAPELVPILAPFTKAGYEALIADDAEIAELRAALRAREEQVAKANAKAVYSRTITVPDYRFAGKQFTYDVQSAADYMADLISLRAQEITRQCIASGITRVNDKGVEVADRNADVNKALFDENPKYAEFAAVMKQISEFLSGLGFNTSYGSGGVWAVKRADVLALENA